MSGLSTKPTRHTARPTGTGTAPGGTRAEMTVGHRRGRGKGYNAH